MIKEQFEQLVEQFYKETGYIAPGKDQPAEMQGGHPYSVRVLNWEDWLNDLTPTQRLRMKYALEIADEDLYECGLTREEIKKELHAIRDELLVEMKINKQETPNSQTELVWRKRASSGWRKA